MYKQGDSKRAISQKVASLENSRADKQYLKVKSLSNRKKNQVNLSQDLRDVPYPSVDSSAVPQNLITNGLIGGVAVKKMKPFLRKGKRGKRLRYVKKWTENQWQQVLCSDESKLDQRVSSRICETRWSRLVLHFSQWCKGQKLTELLMQKNNIRF